MTERGQDGGADSADLGGRGLTGNGGGKVCKGHDIGVKLRDELHRLLSERLMIEDAALF